MFVKYHVTIKIVSKVFISIGQNFVVDDFVHSAIDQITKRNNYCVVSLFTVFRVGFLI